MDVRLFLSHALVAADRGGGRRPGRAVHGTRDLRCRDAAAGAWRAAPGRCDVTSPRPKDSLSARSTSRWPSASSSPSWPLPSWPHWPPGRVMQPLDAVRDADRKMAEGTYGVEVPVPAVTELGALAEDVNRLGAALAETEQRRAALVSDLAHELRTPLTTVRGFLEGLTDGVFEPTPDVLADLTEEVARLQRLVGDLNVLSRADEGASCRSISAAAMWPRSRRRWPAGWRRSSPTRASCSRSSPGGGTRADRSRPGDAAAHQRRRQRPGLHRARRPGDGGGEGRGGAGHRRGRRHRSGHRPPTSCLGSSIGSIGPTVQGRAPASGSPSPAASPGPTVGTSPPSRPASGTGPPSSYGSRSTARGRVQTPASVPMPDAAEGP